MAELEQEYHGERSSDKTWEEIIANKFYDYYESNGWHVGKNPMKDWKAAIRTWERKENYGTRNANSTNGTTAGTSWGEII